MIDINDLRKDAIELHGLTGVDAVHTFYHDETNNIGKLRVIEGGRLNVAELQVFVLGGVVHQGERHPFDIGGLRAALKIQKNAPEIKRELVAKGSFLEILNSRKLTTFLRWVDDNDLMVHYQNLDPLFWSVVDIIDSIIPNLGNDALLMAHLKLKSDLTILLRSNLPATIKLFHNYGYPGLSPENRRPFLDELLAFLEAREGLLPHVNHYMLKGVLQAGRSLESLDFIEGNPQNMLIDNFSDFYRSRIALFKNSTHVLDMEKVIRRHFLRIPLTNNGSPVTNFEFADSKAEPGIQISDVIVGVLGKMQTYFTDETSEQVAHDRNALSGIRLENANLLRDLITKSHRFNISFLGSVLSLHDRKKLDLFLRFPDGNYSE